MKKINKGKGKFEFVDEWKAEYGLEALLRAIFDDRIARIYLARNKKYKNRGKNGEKEAKNKEN